MVFGGRHANPGVTRTGTVSLSPIRTAQPSMTDHDSETDNVTRSFFTKFIVHT
jgi:hypothetical protein